MKFFGAEDGLDDSGFVGPGLSCYFAFTGLESWPLIEVQFLQTHSYQTVSEVWNR